MESMFLSVDALDHKSLLERPTGITFVINVNRIVIKAAMSPGLYHLVNVIESLWQV